MICSKEVTKIPTKRRAWATYAVAQCPVLASKLKTSYIDNESTNMQADLYAHTNETEFRLEATRQQLEIYFTALRAIVRQRNMRRDELSLFARNNMSVYISELDNVFETKTVTVNRKISGIDAIGCCNVRIEFHTYTYR